MTTDAILTLSIIALAWLAHRTLRILSEQAEAIVAMDARLEALIHRLHGKCVMVNIGGGQFAMIQLDLLEEKPTEWKVSRN